MAEGQTVAEVVWPWRESGRPAVPARAEGAPRKRALVQFAVVLGIASLLWLWLGKPMLAVIVAVLSASVTSTAFLAPAVFHRIEAGALRFGAWVGIGLTYALLTPFFYLVFPLGRLILLVTRRDPLQRAFPARAESCWEDRPSVAAPDHYSRQFGHR